MNNNLLYNKEFGLKAPFYIPDDPSKSGESIKQNVIYPSKRITVTPGAVVSALISASILSESAKKKNVTAPTKQKQPDVNGNYYNQIQSIVNNLTVIFTPISVIYSVKNKGKDFTLDTLELSEMTPSMKIEWKNKNEKYFKNILINKIYSEMQIAETGFAREFLKKNAEVEEILTGKEVLGSEYLQDIDILENAKSAALFYLDEDPTKEKIASTISDSIKYHFDIDLTLERPLDKYAGIVSSTLKCFGIGNDNNQSIEKIKKKIENPSYVIKNIQIGFMPDRVIFSLDNQLISTLLIVDMNEDGYSHFIKRDSSYFKNLFTEQVKKNMLEAKIEKKASVENEIIDADTVFNSSSTHPVTLYLMLIKKIGIDALNYDQMVIEDIIKKAFNINSVSEVVMDKIQVILTANQSMSIYTNAYAFEKAVLGLSSKPINFLESQKSDVRFQDIVFAIDVLDRITPFDDIYDNFSKEVINYIADVLSENKIYVYLPTNIIGSPLEPAFNELVNESLTRYFIGKMTLATSDTNMDEQIKLDCEYIADNALIMLKAIRKIITEENPNISGIIDGLLEKKEIKERFRLMIKQQIVYNLSCDTILRLYENTLQKQVEALNLVSGGEQLE